MMDNSERDKNLIKESLRLIDDLEKELAQYQEPIAIIGMSCRFPGGANNPNSYWNLLNQGVDAIVEIPASRWRTDDYYDPDPEAPGKMITKCGGFLNIDVSEFDANFFGISPKEAEYLDPQQRLLLEVSYEAVQLAGIDPKDLKGSLTGVFVGVCGHDYLDLLTATGDKGLINPYLATGNMASTATGRISFFLGLRGPNFAVDTACSSSLVAIDQACESLRNGEANLALAGGVNLILAPDLNIDFSKAGMLAPDGRCKTFDASADGYVRGEGCGIIVLKRLSDAQRDGNTILAVIKASSVNQDGASSGLTVPNGDAQEKLIRRVISKAQLKGADIDYLEAHGTGTSLGDPIEMRAIGATYGERNSEYPLKLGSVKTNIGHLEGAAGIAGVIKVILALQHEMLPKHLHFKKLNPHIDMNFPAEIVTENKEWKRGERIRRAAVSSFGFSGTNAHLILEEGPALSEVEQSQLQERFNQLVDFKRKRYWLDAAIPRVGRALQFLHPLLGEKHTNTNNEIYFLGELNLSSVSYIQDHKVFQYIIYPGVAYIEMILAASRYGALQEEISLVDLVFEKALRLDERKVTNTQVTMTSVERGFEVSIYSQKEDAPWQMHAKGTVLAQSSVEKLTPINIEEIKSRCSVILTKEELYQYTQSVGMGLGESFQTLNKVYSAEMEALGEIKISSLPGGYFGFPGLFDSAMQMLAMFPRAKNTENSNLYLPVGCDSVQFYAPLEEGFVHCEVTEVTDMVKTGNLTLCNLSGKILIKMTGVHFRKTNEQALKQMLAHEEGIADFFYEWDWEEKRIGDVQIPSPLGRWLVFSDSEVSQFIAKSLEEKGGSCKSIALTEAPKSKEEFAALLQAETFSGIIHCASLSSSELLSFEHIEQANDSGVKSVLHLTQALLEFQEKIKVPLFLLTRNIISTNVPASPLLGFYKTLIAEQPQLTIKLIDLEANYDAAMIEQALFSKENENIIVLRDSKSYVPRLLRVKNLPSEEAGLFDSKIRSECTYLITGGLGGLGLTLTKMLAEKGAGHIVLTGRRALDEVSQSTLKNLESENTKITYEAIDIGEESAVKNLLERLEKFEKPLKGIFHLAGILDDATLQEQDWNHFQNVFRPKVYGSFYLHQYSKNLDFFVIFSSIASSLGNPGQSNYAAANAFMDALCEYRKQQGLPANSIAWGPWAEVGMAKELFSRHEKTGILGLKPAEGLRALEIALAYNRAEITIANIHWKNYLKQMIEAPRYLENFAEQKSSHENLLANLELIPQEERLAFVRSYVVDGLRSVLGIPSSETIDERKGFFDMGLDSLMATALKNKLQVGLGKSAILSSTVVFDYPSIEKMTKQLGKLLKLESLELRKKEEASVPLQPNEPIAIIGMSCRFPGGSNSVNAYWDLLEQGKDASCDIPSDRWDVDSYFDPDPEVAGKMITKRGGFVDFDVSQFDADFFRISPREAEYLDPQQRVLLEVCYEAMLSAGIKPESLDGSLTAVFLGMCATEYMDLIKEANNKKGIGAYMGTGNAPSTAAGRVSFIFGLQGPNFAIDSACSSSLVAIHQACESLHAGDANLALAGGVSLILTPDLYINFSKANMLSPDGTCKTFDAAANGYMRGEGCGMLVLKRLSDAKRDGDTILALIKGSGVNQNGSSGGLTVPNGDAQESLIQHVLRKASLKGSDIDYVEAHGTGTPLGDPIEVRAIGAAYGERPANNVLKIGSVKPNIGHLEGAAGISGVIKTILALQNETIPTNIHFHSLNPKIELNFPGEIVTKNIPWPRGERIRRAGVSSFGFSGINAHLILEEGPTLSEKEKTLLQERFDNFPHYQRKRYWPEFLDKKRIDSMGVRISDWFYRIEWIAQEDEENTNTQKSPRRYLVFQNETRNHFILDSKLQEYKIINEPGFLYESEINEQVTDILYFSSFDSSCHQLLSILKFLIQKQLNPRLWILTDEAQTVTGKEENLNSVQSLLLGFGKVIALEHPEFRCVRIDYDDSITFEILLNELTSDSPEDEIAIRKNKRYVPRLIHYTPEMQNTLNISAEGSYLITGGLGGLGLTCVDWMIAKGAKHLILTSRSAPKQTAQTKFTTYREQGVEIIVQQADVSQKSDVEILFHRIKEMQRPLTGIMHAAGVSFNNNIINQTPEQFEKVLLPKVNGTQNLDEEVRKGKINLDFFLLFSSVSGALGSASTSSYTAANYFLNEYAKRGRREGLPFISISWGPWSSVGMASEEAEKELRLGYELISPENGLKAMEIALQGTEVCPIVAPMNWPRYFENLQYLGRIYSNIQSGLEKSTLTVRDELGLSLESALPDARRKIALEYARKIIKQVLGLNTDEKIDDKKGFFEMGMDSLMATELRNKLQNALGDRCVLRPTIAFDYPNLVALNEEILKQLGYREDLASLQGIKSEEIIEQEIDQKVDQMSIEDVLKKLKE